MKQGIIFSLIIGILGSLSAYKIYSDNKELENKAKIIEEYSSQNKSLTAQNDYLRNQIEEMVSALNTCQSK